MFKFLIELTMEGMKDGGLKGETTKTDSEDANG
jgi:hypothetical protein